MTTPTTTHQAADCPMGSLGCSVCLPACPICGVCLPPAEAIAHLEAETDTYVDPRTYTGAAPASEDWELALLAGEPAPETFEVGDAVVINSPGWQFHGQAGVIVGRARGYRFIVELPAPIAGGAPDRVRATATYLTKAVRS